MSIQSEITRLTNKRNASLTAVANKGVTVPSGSTMDDLPDLIDLIVVDPTYSVSKTLTNVTSSNDDTKVIAGNSFYADLIPTSGYVIDSITVTMGGVDITDQVFTPGTGAKAITANGTYSAASDNLSGYSSVVVNVPTGSTPTGTTQISISSNGTTTEDVTNYANAEISVNVPNSYAAADEGKVVSNGTLVSQTSSSTTQNGTIDTTLINSLTVNVSGGSGKNVQVYSGYAETNATEYTATSVSITVAKAGTYKCSWSGLRNTTGGTSGSRLYKNGTAVGSAHTSSWIRSFGQYATETLTLAKDDVLTIYARARGSSYWMVVFNLMIEEQ